MCLVLEGDDDFFPFSISKGYASLVGIAFPEFNFLFDHNIDLVTELENVASAVFEGEDQTIVTGGNAFQLDWAREFHAIAPVIGDAVAFAFDGNMRIFRQCFTDTFKNSVIARIKGEIGH